MDEIWKDIAGYEGLYQVSNRGRIKSLSHYARNGINSSVRFTKGKVLSLYKMPNGYMQVQLSKGNSRKKHYVHRIVANVFLDNKSNLSDVNHIDGDKTNNAVENLEWCSHKDNQIHMIENRMTKRAIPVICLETLKAYNSLSEAERMTGSNRKGIKLSCDHKNEYKGYSWRYICEN